MKHPPLLFAGLVATTSGFFSLVYQVVWERTLKYNFGGDTVSAAIVTGAFLLGLGIGALIFGKWRRHPFRVYALVEISIGVYAIISYYLLAPLAIFLGRFFNYSLSDTTNLRFAVITGCVLFLLLPCILMGGALPLMFNCFIRSSTYNNKTVGMIYGLNTLGAALGILAVPFLFFNHVTLPSTLLIVGTANVLLGATIAIYGRRVAPPSEAAQTGLEKRALSNVHLSLPPLLALSFISGFITLSFEIVLFRAIGLIMVSSPYMFPLVLMPLLLGLAMGSMVLTRFRHYSIGQALGRVGGLFTLSAVAVLSSVLVRNIFAFDNFSIETFLYQGHLVGPLLLLIMPFAFLAGGVFPLLLRLASNKGQELPARTGRIYLFNSLGAFLGAMLTQFIGFPYLGAKGVIITLFLLALFTGAACFMGGTGSDLLFGPKKVFIGVGLIVAFTPLFIPLQMWEIFAFGYSGPLVDKIEGVSGIATLHWDPTRTWGPVKVNGQYMSALPYIPKHVALAAMTLSLPRRETVLVLGLGGGSMVKELAADPEVKRIDVVDWSHELPLLLQMPDANKILDDMFNHPKINLYTLDARVAVRLYEPATFDVVIENLSFVDWSGATGLKSVMFFGEIQRILKPTGVFVYDPNYSQPSSREAILAGLLENFAVVTENREAGLIFASTLPVEIDRRRADQALEQRGELIELTQPYRDWLLEDFKPITAAELNNIPPIRDDLLIYEYRLFGLLDTLAEQAKNTDKPTPLPTRQPVTLNPALYQHYVGQYQISPEFLIVVSQEGAQLMVQTANEKKVELLPKSETDFFLKDVDAQIEFMKGSSGQITGLLLYHQKQKLFGEKIQ
jgi:predicted membrane-bound spermidine synthase